MADSWQDKYMSLRDEHKALKVAYNAKVEEVKRTNVQLTKIENLLKMRDKMDTQGGGGGYMSSVVRAENENIIKKLYEEKASLMAKNAEFEKRITKLKEINEKYKKNEKVLKRKAGTPFTGMSHRSTAPAAPPPDTPPPTEQQKQHQNEDTNSAKLMELTSRLGLRLENAEQQLASVREENRLLKQKTMYEGGEGRPLRDASDVAMAAAGASYEHRHQPHQSSSSQDFEQTSKLQREVQDLKAKLRLLQTRYDHLEAKARAQSELQQGSYDQLEDYNRRIRELRRALQDLQLEKTTSDSKASRCDELELEINELRNQNDKFENTIKKLCESPFISSAYDQEERSNKLHEYEANFKAQQLKMEHLQETAHNHHAALVAMKQQCESLKYDKENALNELEELRNLHVDSKQQTQLLKDKMRLYTSNNNKEGEDDDDIDMDQLEQALTIVKRRANQGQGGPDLNHLNLEVIDDGGGGGGIDSDQEIVSLRHKVKELYNVNQTLQFDIERSESMLKAQLAINRELHLELEKVEQGKGLTHKEQLDHIKKLEGENEKLKVNIKTLEIERKQRLYDIRKKKRNQNSNGLLSLTENSQENDDDEEDNENDEDTLMNELSPGEELAPEENIIEVWVRSAEIKDEVWEKDAPSFVLIDFFNFESEASPVLDGKSPKFDFASSYKIVVDDFLLKFLATQPLIIELCRVRGVDFELVGRASISLHSLLTSRPSIKIQNEPLIGRGGIGESGSMTVGSFNVEIRMGKVIDELYQLYLNNHPQERLKIEQIISERLGDHHHQNNQGQNNNNNELINFEKNRLHNELEVMIHSAQQLPCREGIESQLQKSPTAFVHFQLLHFPDSFTRAISESRSPIFEHLERFPLPTNPQMLSMLSSGNGHGGATVEFTVLDDIGDNEANCIGTCSVDLKSLSEGDPINAMLSLKNESERNVGILNIKIKWRYPFRTEKELGPHAIGASDVHELTYQFSPSKDGLVDWKLFLLWLDPSPKLKHLINILRLYDERNTRITTSSSSSSSGGLVFYGLLFENVNKDTLTLKDFIENILKYLNIDQDHHHEKQSHRNENEVEEDLSQEVTYEELEEIFKEIDRNKDGSISKTLLLFLLQPRSHSRLLLEEKCRNKMKHIKINVGIDLVSAFTSVDVSGLGKCSRNDFKSILKNHIGFQLVGVDDQNNEQQLNDNQQQQQLGRNIYDESTLFEDIHHYRRQPAVDELSQRSSGGGMRGSHIDESMNEIEAQKKLIFDEARKQSEQHGLDLSDSLHYDQTADDIILPNNHAQTAMMNGTNRGTTLQFNNSQSMSQIDINDTMIKRESTIEEEDDDGGGGRGETNTDDQLIIAVREMLASVSTSSFLRMTEAMDPTRSGVVGWPGIEKALVASGWGDIGSDLVHKAAQMFYPEGGSGGDEELISYHNFAITLLPKPEASSPSGFSLRIDTNPQDEDGRGQRGDLDYGDVGMPIGDAGPMRISISITRAEEALFNALAEIEGMGRRPDLRPEFEQLANRTSSSNLVSRKQFLHVVGRYFGDVLNSASLRSSLLDFFISIDKDNIVCKDGQVDYQAFIKFLDYRSPDVSTGIHAIENMLIHQGSEKVFISYDPRGLGIISVEDFISSLEELGVDTVGGRRLPMTEVASLFRNGHGGVDYKAFMNYCYEHGISKKIRLAEKEVKKQINIIRQKTGKIKDIRASMRVSDPSGRGLITESAFEHSLQVIGVHLDPSNMKSLCFRFNKNGGIDYNQFSTFIESSSSRFDDENDESSYNVSSSNCLPLTDSERETLRLRASSTVDEVFTRVGEQNAGSLLLSCYRHYDFRDLGVVGLSEFITASKRAGFALTRNKLASLAQGFLASDDYDNKLNVMIPSDSAIHYQRFLVWVTPPASSSGHLQLTAPQPMGSSSSSSSGGGKAGGGQQNEDMLRHVREKLHAATKEKNIRRMFEEYDVRNNGFVEGRAIDDCLSSLPLTPQEIAVIMKMFDVRNDYSFCYAEFARFVEAGQPDVEHKPTYETRLKELLLKCVKRGVDYRALFDRQDKEGSGLMNKNDFRLALNDLHANLSEADVVNIETDFAGEGHTVRYLELLHQVMPPRGGGELWRHEEKLRTIIKKRFQWFIPGKLKKAFKHFDQNRAGIINLTDLSSGLRALKFKLSPSQESDLFDLIDLDNDGYVSYSDFVVFVKDPNHHHIAHRVRSELNLNQVSPQMFHRLLQVNHQDSHHHHHHHHSTEQFLSTNDLNLVFRRVGCDLFDNEIKRLAMRFDINEDGNVSMGKLMKFIAGEPEKYVMETTSSVPSTTRLLKKLALQVQLAADNGVAAESVFELLDEGDGTVTTKGLRDCFLRLGVDLEPKDIAVLAAAFPCSNRTGYHVAWVDLLKEISSILSSSSSSSTKNNNNDKDDKKNDTLSNEASEEVMRALSRELRILGYDQRDLKKFAYAFDKLDPTMRGSVNTRDFRGTIESLGLELSDRELRSLIGLIDRSGDGIIDYHEFLKICDKSVSSTSVRGSKAEIIKIFGEELEKLDNSKLGRPNFRRIMTAIDRNDSNMMSRYDFKEALELAGMNLPNMIINNLFELLAEDDGLMKITRFLRFVDDNDNGSSLRTSRYGVQDSRELGGDHHSVIHRLKKLIKKAVDSGLDLVECFEHFDIDRSGDIDEEEFQRGLRKLQIDISRDEASRIIDSFPGHRHGKIKYRNFVKALDITRSHVDIEDLDYLVQKELTKLSNSHHHFKGFLSLFHDIDIDRTGVIDRREFQRVLNMVGFDLPVRDIRRLMQKFDRNGDGMISYHDFIEWTERTATRRSQEYSPRRTGGGGYSPRRSGYSLRGGGGYSPRRSGGYDDTGHGGGGGGLIKEGDKVECLYKGKGTKWYKGVIKRVNRDGTYDIAYDDGDNEVGAIERNMKKL